VSLYVSPMYRLGHDLVRLVDKSAPDSRRADVWVETRTETNSGAALEIFDWGVQGQGDWGTKVP